MAAAHASKSEIPSLHGLRGLAVVMVFVSHAALAGYAPAVFEGGLGRRGVALFFILSGFLMAHLYAGAAFAPNVRSYGAGRIARVVPLYVAVLLATWAAGRAGLGGIDLIGDRELLISLLFLKSWGVFWTIPVEIQFYLVFCGLWWVADRRGRGAFLQALLALNLVALAVALRIDALAPEAPAVYLPFWIPYFSIGVLVGALGETALAPLRAAWGRARLPLLALAAAAAIGSLPAVQEAAGFETGDAWEDPVSLLGMTGLFLLCFLDPAWPRLMETRLLVRLGRISYSIYLLHVPVLKVVEKLLGHGGAASAGLGFAAASAATLAAASLSHALLEQPARRLLRRLLERPRPVAASSGVAPGADAS